MKAERRGRRSGWSIADRRQDVGLDYQPERGESKNPLSSLKRCERHRFSAEECARRALSEGVRGGGKEKIIFLLTNKSIGDFNYV